VAEDDGTNERRGRDDRQLRSTFDFDRRPSSANEQLPPAVDSTSRPSVEPTTVSNVAYYTAEDERLFGELDDGTSSTDENAPAAGSDAKHIDERRELCAAGKEFGIRNEERRETAKCVKSVTALDANGVGDETDGIDHHDSDSESFYDIWGDDDEWLFGNESRNAVRNIHR